MTRKSNRRDRDAAIELLLCAADLCENDPLSYAPLWDASSWLEYDGGTDVISDVEQLACDAIDATGVLLKSTIQLLEAAQLIEDGLT